MLAIFISTAHETRYLPVSEAKVGGVYTFVLRCVWGVPVFVEGRSNMLPMSQRNFRIYVSVNTNYASRLRVERPRDVEHISTLEY